MREVTYEKLLNTNNELEAQITAAEAHGLLTGLLSVGQKPQAVWYPILLENLDGKQPTSQQTKIYTKLAKQIMVTFEKMRFDFNLLLPNDEMPLGDRLEALGCWCRGYLSGLALAGLEATDLNNAIVKELISDLSQISRLSSETDASEEDESNYAELVEFMRIAVQNIQLELKGSMQGKMLH